MGRDVGPISVAGSRSCRSASWPQTRRRSCDRRRRGSRARIAAPEQDTATLSSRMVVIYILDALCKGSRTHASSVASLLFRAWSNTGFSSGSPMRRDRRAGGRRIVKRLNTNRKDPTHERQVSRPARAARSCSRAITCRRGARAAAAIGPLRSPARANSSSSRAAARCVRSDRHNVIEQSQGSLLQTNPELAKDLNDVGTVAHTNLGAALSNLPGEARSFTPPLHRAGNQGLVAFYKSPSDGR